MMPKINKNIIIGISIAVVLVFSIIISVALFQKGKISSEKEVAPEKEETIEEVLERLTPAEPESLTEEDKREQEELLKQLTPTQPKPMTEEEQKELEEVLKQLTP
jgi:septal ring-binding cell division protein DamX